MAGRIEARELKARLAEGREIALFDVREHGQYGEGHPFLAVPLAYSTLEARLPALAPRRGVHMVLVDDGDGVAEQAARRAGELGYSDVHVLAGGARAWAAAGLTLYKGVNVPSKAFGELLETARHTPRLTARALAEMQQARRPHVIVDGRPFAEYSRFSIPGGVCCPNGELALRIDAIATDPAIPIVVNCAGRTRSILGAQTLIDLGVRNPVYTLENGTQGWFLAGLELERGAALRMDQAAPRDLAARRRAAQALAEANGVPTADVADLRSWLGAGARTTYVFDVRGPEEFAADGVAGTVHAPGGQLVQATDQWVGVRNARIVLVDDEDVRAPVIASWLRQMGHDAVVLQGGVAAARELAQELAVRIPSQVAGRPRRIEPRDLASRADREAFQLVDLRAGREFRKAHISGAAWGIRPRLDRLRLDVGRPVVLTGDPERAALAAKDLGEAGHHDVALLAGELADWRAAGLEITAGEAPSDVECIDFLFFTHERHSGNAAAARQYLEWETGLVAQLDAAERGLFRIRGT